MTRLVLAPAARDDLDAIHSYISADNSQVADRVIDSAFETFALLTRNPELGRGRNFQKPSLRALRSFGISTYPNYVIFYRLKEDVVEIVRVLHGARDFDELFGVE